MTGFLKAVFTWWHSATVGTRWYTKKRGVYVGADENGNKYYQEKAAVRADLPRRRWVIYNGAVEATKISPDWHGWMHHTFDEPPTSEPFDLKPWEKPHRPNMTGTKSAYHPAGSLWTKEGRAKATGDYEAWKPE